MNLQMDQSVASNYKSPSQIARVVSEKWVDRNMYCPSCLSSLKHTKTGKAVIDYECSYCNESYQLKSSKKPFRGKVTNSAYQPKIDAIKDGSIPNFIFLQYEIPEWLVRELFIIPRYFITKSIIQKRKPLTSKARRSGWVGSIILFKNLPKDAKIFVIKDKQVVPKKSVKQRLDRFSFLRGQPLQSRGWISDVLACIRHIGQKTFTLSQVYEFEDELAELHPKNKHIKAKIRQQLQVLRDKGILEFLGEGEYKIKD